METDEEEDEEDEEDGEGLEEGRREEKEEEEEDEEEDVDEKVIEVLWILARAWGELRMALAYITKQVEIVQVALTAVTMSV